MILWWTIFERMPRLNNNNRSIGNKPFAAVYSVLSDLFYNPKRIAFCSKYILYQKM